MNERIRYNDEWEYEILENGYKLYSNNGCIVKQVDNFSKIFVPNGTYEENAIAQLDQITKPQPGPDPSTDAEKLRADVDYMSLMLDIPLPSEEEEGE